MKRRVWKITIEEEGVFISQKYPPVFTPARVLNDLQEDGFEILRAVEYARQGLIWEVEAAAEESPGRVTHVTIKIEITASEEQQSHKEGDHAEPR